MNNNNNLNIINIKIKSIRAGYIWNWDVPSDICGICQQPFEQMCSECTHPRLCVPSIGKCRHTYHKHCIDRWIINNNLCPLCRLDWKE